MAGLEEVGIPGPDHLREALTNCTDPLTAIEEFQMQNGILLPSLRPALPFLDLHSVHRLDFHQSVMEELREKLTHRITEVADGNDKGKNKMLNDLLNKCFPVVKVKALRPVVLCIMKHIPKIKAEYLNVILEDKTLYKESAIEVKQQIWQDNQALFGDEVSPLFGKYIDDREEVLFDHKSSDQSFFSVLPKTRRQNEVVQQLAKMVGQNIKLYDMVLQFLRTLYLRTRNVHYCTLRAELLMALHDNEANEIVNVDPCHKYTWCLDACVREKFVDSKRARELQGFLDSMRRGHEQVLGDLSMILCDPHAIHTLATSAMKALSQSVGTESLPRHNDELLLLLRMLSLGLGAWNMIDSQHFKEPKMDSSYVTRFLPCIMSLMVDDQIYSATARKSEDDYPKLPAVPAQTAEMCRDNPLATILLLYYTHHTLAHHDTPSAARVLPSLAAHGDPDVVYSDTALHSLVSGLLAAQGSAAEAFTSGEMCVAVFDDFFLPSISRENVLRHLIRLLWWVHHRVATATLERIMDAIRPNNQHSEAVRNSYRLLEDKIRFYQPSPVAEPDKLDSPLMAVPAPTPAHP